MLFRIACSIWSSEMKLGIGDPARNCWQFTIYHLPMEARISAPTHQNFLWITESKRGDAEIAEDFAEKKWILCHGTRMVFIFNDTKPYKLGAFLRELCVSAFR
jgi:hypothetical protein